MVLGSAMNEVAIPVYQDVKFWSFVVSGIALVLSQLPPLRLLLRRARLNIDVFSHISISHRFGNPNAQLHLIVSNAGGRKIRVKNMKLQFSPSNGQSFSIPAINFLQKQDDKATVLFTPFTLAPGDEWAHIVNFVNVFTRQEDKRIRDAIHALQTHLEEKESANTQDSPYVVADQEYVAPLIAQFERTFRWHPDEYEVTLTVETEQAKYTVEEQFRFVLFESDTREMEKPIGDYYTGIGVFRPDRHPGGVLVPVQKAKGIE